MQPKLTQTLNSPPSTRSNQTAAISLSDAAMSAVLYPSLQLPRHHPQQCRQTTLEDQKTSYLALMSPVSLLQLLTLDSQLNSAQSAVFSAVSHSLIVMNTMSI